MKKDIIKKVAWKLDVKPKEARPSVDGLIELLKSTLKNGDNVEINGFGKFIIRQKNKRFGRNPVTGKEAEISSRKVVVFKPSKFFCNIVNDKITQEWEEY